MPCKGIAIHSSSQHKSYVANTYTQIHIQAIVAVKFRSSVITAPWKDRLHQYITGIVQNHTHKMLCINSMPDHPHLFFGFTPVHSLSDLIRLVKAVAKYAENQEIHHRKKIFSEEYQEFLRKTRN